MAFHTTVMSLIIRGDLAEAERLAEAASNVGAAADQPETRSTIYAGQLANIRYNQGAIRRGRTTHRAGAGDTPRCIPTQAVLAEASTFIGRHGPRPPNRSLRMPSPHRLPTPDDQSLTTVDDAAGRRPPSASVDREAAATPPRPAAPIPQRTFVITGSTVHPAVAYYLGRLDHFLDRSRGRRAPGTPARWRSPNARLATAGRGHPGRVGGAPGRTMASATTAGEPGPWPNRRSRPRPAVATATSKPTPGPCSKTLREVEGSTGRSPELMPCGVARRAEPPRSGSVLQLRVKLEVANTNPRARRLTWDRT